MAGYGQFCAVARALDVLGERWTLLVARELLLGATTFSDIRRGLPGIPRATLASRLRGLRHAGVVEVVHRAYRLTETGAALAPVLRVSWAQLIRLNGVRVHGDTTLINNMRHWFLRYLFTPDALHSAPAQSAGDR